MRKALAILALTLALPTLADAKPHRKPTHRKADTAWMRSCIKDRASVGISAAEARASCRAEQPDDDIAAAKRQLDVARAAAKLAKAKERVTKAIEACEQAVVDGCVAGAADDGSTDCEDDALKAAFAVCH